MADVGFVEDSSTGRRRRRRKSDDDGAWDSSRINYIIRFDGTAASTDDVKVKAFEAAMAKVVAECAITRFQMYASLSNTETEIELLVKANIKAIPFAAASLLELHRASTFSVLVSWDENSNWATNGPVLPALWDQLFKVEEFRKDFNIKLAAAKGETGFTDYGVTGFTDDAADPHAVERTYSFTQVTGTVAVVLSYSEPPGAQFGIMTSNQLDSGAAAGAGAESIFYDALKSGLSKGMQVDVGYVEVSAKVQAAHNCVYFFTVVVNAVSNSGDLADVKKTIGGECARLDADKGFKNGFVDAAAKTFKIAPSHLSITKVFCADPTGTEFWTDKHEVQVSFKYEAPCQAIADTEPAMINSRMNDCAAATCFPDRTADNGDGDGAADAALADADIVLTVAQQTEDSKAIVAKATGTYTIAGGDGVGKDISVKEWVVTPNVGADGTLTATPVAVDTKTDDTYLVKYDVSVRNDQSSRAGFIVGDVFKKHTAAIAMDNAGTIWSDFTTGMTDSGQLKLRGITVDSCTAMADAVLKTKRN